LKIVLINLLISVFLFAQADQFSEAQKAVESGQYPDALAKVEAALSSSGDDADLLLLGAQIAVKLDDLNKAKDFMVKANTVDPKNVDIINYWEKLKTLSDLMSYGQKTFKMASYDEAMESFDSTIVKFPDFALGYYMKGQVYYRQDNFDDAVANYKIARKLNPFEEKYSKAISAIASKLYNEGNDQQRRKKYQDSIPKYKKALEYDPTLSQALFRISYAYYKLSDFAEAKNYLNKLVEQDPGHAEARKLLGDIYAKENDFETAVEWYKKATEIKPDYTKAYYSEGKILQTLGKNDEAIVVLDKAVELDPTYYRAYELLGIIHQEKNENDAAILNYRLAIKNNKKPYSAYWRLASVYNIEDKCDQAETAAKAALDLKPNYAAAYFELGLAEKCLGKKVAALESWKKILDDREWGKSAQYELKKYYKELEN